MQKYFLFDYPFGSFELFSRSHFLALLTIITINVLLILWVKKLPNEQRDKIIRYSLATALILQELSLNIWRFSWGEWHAGTSLPLHLCGAAVVLSAIMLVNKNYRLYEIVYFWGLGGAIQALLQPDIGHYAFPHYRYFQFFTSHGLIVMASLYSTFSFRYRPTVGSVYRVFLITNLYMVFIAVFNWLTDGNYLFICHKPETASIIDFMDPWPWYVLVLEIVALISFFIYYSPFAIKDSIGHIKIAGIKIGLEHYFLVLK